MGRARARRCTLCRKRCTTANTNDDAKAHKNSIPPGVSQLEPHMRALLRGDKNAMPLCEATGGWILEKIEKLKSPDVNLAPSGVFLLHRNIEVNDIHGVKALIEIEGADCDIINPAGITPLVSAVTNNCSTKCLRMLLDAGADVNKPDSCGDTPLMCAVKENKITCVRMLIDAGAHVDVAHDKDGNTPLMSAAANGYTKCVKALLAAGADVHKTDDSGVTSFYPIWSRIQTANAGLRY